MLKKLGIAGATATMIALAVTGVAHAGGSDDGSGDGHGKSRGSDSGHSIDCSSHETTRQSNVGDQLIGGNSNINDINGPAGASADQIAICPNVGNNNRFKIG